MADSGTAIAVPVEVGILNLFWFWFWSWLGLLVVVWREDTRWACVGLSRKAGQGRAGLHSPKKTLPVTRAHQFSTFWSKISSVVRIRRAHVDTTVTRGGHSKIGNKVTHGLVLIAERGPAIDPPLVALVSLLAHKLRCAICLRILRHRTMKYSPCHALYLRPCLARLHGKLTFKEDQKNQV